MTRASTRVAAAALAIGLSACGAGAVAALPAKFVAPVCPARAPVRVAANPWRPARTQLAPAGAKAIRLCRYDGPRAPVVRSVLIARPSRSASLVRQFDRLPPPNPGAYSCPVDQGAQIVALLAYRSGHRVTISVDPNGCNFVTNGDVLRTALGPAGRAGPRLLARLERLTS